VNSATLASLTPLHLFCRCKLIAENFCNYSCTKLCNARAKQNAEVFCRKLEDIYWNKLSESVLVPAIGLTHIHAQLDEIRVNVTDAARSRCVASHRAWSPSVLCRIKRPSARQPRKSTRVSRLDPCSNSWVSRGGGSVDIATNETTHPTDEK